MKKFITLLIMVLGAVLYAAPKRGVLESYSPELITLKNANISISIAPDALGRVVSFKLNKSNAEMLNPTKITRIWLSPLHEIRGDNFQGIRELLWRGKVNGSVPMQVTAKKDDSITVYSKAYGATCFEVTRSITLLPDGFGFIWKTKFTNHSRQSEKCDLWYNFQGVEPALARIPVAGGTNPVRGKGRATFPRDFMFTKGHGEHFLPPGADYAAFVETKQDAVWAVLFPPTELKPDGLFYSWGNRSANSIRTMEPVLKSRNLKSGESFESQMTMLIFPGLKDFSGMVGLTGFEFKPNGKKSVLRLVNAVARPAETLEVELNGKNGSKKFTFPLPVRKAGTLSELTVDFDQLPETGIAKLGNESGKLFFPLNQPQQ